MQQAEKTLTEAAVSESLVDRILDGDAGAEIEMVERYQKGLGVMLFNRARDREIAQDVAQETWVLVLQKIRDNQLRDRKKLAAFIIQIAKNQLIMRQRNNQRHDAVSGDEAPEPVDTGFSPDKALGHAQLGQSVATMLGELSIDRDRELLKRFYLIGDDKQSLCEEFDLTPAHFDRVMFRARERFRSLWEKNIGSKYF